MILVIVGTQDMAFDRLIEQVVQYAFSDQNQEEIIIQYGYSHKRLAPDFVKFYDYIEKEQLQLFIDEARLLITHAGVGTIMDALKKQKNIIVMPRLKKYQEHHNDHQVEIAMSFANLGYVIETNEIIKAIELAKTYPFKPYPFNSSTLIAYLQQIVDKE